jgi:hypothetical protein
MRHLCESSGNWKRSRSTLKLTALIFNILLCTWMRSWTVSHACGTMSCRVPNSNQPLPIQCPKCQHVSCVLVVKSITVMMVTCASCGHTWAIEYKSLPEDIQEKVPGALRGLKRF